MTKAAASTHAGYATPDIPQLKWARLTVMIFAVLLRYLRNLNGGRLILWCYFIWYLVVLVRYFDPNLSLWGTSFGLCLIIGTGLYINSTRSGKQRYYLPFWPAFRMFMMPLCVSSFSALVKGKGFFLIFSPNPWEVTAAAGLCALFCLAAAAARVIPEFRP